MIEDTDHISEIMSDINRVQTALQKGINDALLKHKQAGNPVCEMRDGKVVWVLPGDIQIKE